MLVLSYCLKGYAAVKQTIIEKKHAAGVTQSFSKVAKYIERIEEVKNLSHKEPADEETLLGILGTQGYGGIRDSHEDYTTADTWSSFSEPDENTEGRKCAIHIVREHLPKDFLKSKKVNLSYLI